MNTTRDGLPGLRIGALAGTVGMLCCVGPTMLAIVGVISAATAHAWATTLYDGYSWWFRTAGVLVIVVLVLVARRRRDRCAVPAGRVGRRLLGIGAVAVLTYAALYAGTTWLGAGVTVGSELSQQEAHDEQ